jgi:F0F1-type ATP synthase epsilon subunit
MSFKPLKVIIKTSEEILFNGEADRISSFNDVGRFDVLPMHANFITMINKELTLFKNHQKIKEMKIEQAIMKVKKDIVHIFLGIETFALTADDLAAQNKK